MLLFIASEVMLFGAFFTVYFFVRVVNPDVTSWPPEVEGHTYHLPKFVAGINTAILLTSSFTMHWATQAIKRGHHTGLKAGLVLTLAMGWTFLLTQLLEYSGSASRRGTGRSPPVFYGLTGLHGAHVFVGLTLLSVATTACVRGHFSRSTTTASSSPESTGTSST